MMNKVKTKKYIKISVILVLCILFVNKCLITNEPDSIDAVDEEKMIKAYTFDKKGKTTYYGYPESSIPQEVKDDPELLYHWEHYFSRNFNLRDGLIIGLVQQPRWLPRTKVRQVLQNTAYFAGFS